MLLTTKARKQKGVLPVYWHIETLGKYSEIKPDSYFSIYKKIIPEPESLIKYIRIAAEEHLWEVDFFLILNSSVSDKGKSKP